MKIRFQLFANLSDFFKLRGIVDSELTFVDYEKPDMVMVKLNSRVT
jgi:hypothetical protein